MADPVIPQVTAAPVRAIQLPALEGRTDFYPERKTVLQCMLCGYASFDGFEFIGHRCRMDNEGHYWTSREEHE